MRPSWEEYFIQVMDAVALRGSCDRGRSGAVIVKDKRILATGYVGAPSGLPTCEDEGHEMIKRFEMTQLEWELEEDGKSVTLIPNHHFSNHCIRTVHAELNAILNCARNGVPTVGATIYCTMTPCPNCAMAIIQAGIIEVIAKNLYQKGDKSIKMFEQVGIKYKTLNEQLLY